MLVEDQAEVVALLEAPRTHGGEAVARVDTHGARVFVAGDRAWKLKRAVRYDYMDFSTPERRRACCEAEVRLNRRTAPGLYLGVVAVTREASGSLALGGDGRPVDWVVEMQRFQQDALLDQLGEAGRLELGVMDALAEAVARFHAMAEPRRDRGGHAAMAWIVDGNEKGFAEYGRTLDPASCAAVTAGTRAALTAHGDALDARRDAGFVRQCHGDLHLRNIVLLEGVPTLFDAIEFNDVLACIDTHYDLAFLVMDLWRHRLPRHANAVWNGYLARTRDLGGLPLVPLFLSCRAAVRAMTSAMAATLQADAARARALEALAGEYLEMAGALLVPPPPGLVAIGGFSGSGKSTLARGLALSLGGVPGAVLRSDEIRKELSDAPALERLGPEAYTAAMSARVYETLFARARTVLHAGHSAVLDAVFAQDGERAQAEAIARQVGVAFTGLWLEAPEPVLCARVDGRRDDASDAGASVVRMQLARGAGSPAWARVDATPGEREVLRQAAGLVKESGQWAAGVAGGAR